MADQRERPQGQSEPGQDSPDTLSYDRSPLSDGGSRATLATQASRKTAVMPEGFDLGAFDPVTVGPAPQAPLALTPATPLDAEAVLERAPGTFRTGDRVDHFEILGLVGQGGMGCVYKALDHELGRTVAIKTLHGLEHREPQSLARFKREAQAASRVVHPNLVIIYSSGSFGDTPYMVMEYLSGRSLAAEIAEGPLAIARTADILGAACAGVYAAHRAEVIHRDLKPANVFLARTPMGETPKILDFGISRIGSDNSSLTGTGDVIGTTYYLAPEQAAGRDTDARADQYALGVILYECLTGVRPFTGNALYTIMRNIMDGVFEPPSHRRQELPRDLEAVVLRAMSRLPEARFPRVRDLGLALVPFMSPLGQQRWGHHFAAPEAEMPVVPSLALPAGAGIKPPAARAQAPTKILPPQPIAEAAPTHTIPPFEDIEDEAARALGKPERLRLLVLLSLLFLASGLAWFWWRSQARVTTPSTSPEVPAVEVPPSATPAAPALPLPSAPRLEPSFDPAMDDRNRDKSAAKIARPKEASETPDNLGSGTKPQAEPSAGGQEHDMW